MAVFQLDDACAESVSASEGEEEDTEFWIESVAGGYQVYLTVCVQRQPSAPERNCPPSSVSTATKNWW